MDKHDATPTTPPKTTGQPERSEWSPEGTPKAWITWPGLLIVLFVAGFGYVALGGPQDAESTLERFGGIPDVAMMPESTYSIAEMSVGLASVDVALRDRAAPIRSAASAPPARQPEGTPAVATSAPTATDAAAGEAPADGNVMTYEHD